MKRETDTRIRYNKRPDGLYQSVRTFDIKIEKENVRTFVVLDYNRFLYAIVDSVYGDAIVNGGNTKNKYILRKQAKKALKELGYVFSNEVRGGYNVE